MKNLGAIAALLGSWANALPSNVRKAIYKTVKILAALATLALLIIPSLGDFGVHWTGATVATTVVTAILSFLGHLADANTDPNFDVLGPDPDTEVSDGGDPEPQHGK